MNPAMAPQEGTAAYELWRFAMIANKTSPHPLDWRRFYQFIVFAHARRVGWDAYYVQEKLREYGFAQRQAEELASAYWHGRCALFMSKPRLRTDSHRKWIRRGGTPWT